MDGNKRARRRRRRGVETLKSVLILLLSLSAVYLTMLALDYSRVNWAPIQAVLSLFRPEQEQASASDTLAPSGQAALSPIPVRMAVCDGVDRFASQYDTRQTDQLFESLSILLSEALSGAQAPEEVPEETWRQALQAPGVWFDFLGTLPLQALRTWMGAGGASPIPEAHAARQMAVALDGDGQVRLLYHNESDGLYYACATDVVWTGHMDALVSGYGGNGFTFAFEQEEGSGYEALDPYVLLSPDPLQLPVYRMSDPLSGLDSATVSAIQQALLFQAQGYPVAGGIRIREGRETLELGTDGMAAYHSGEEDASRYTVGDGADPLVLAEATWRLAADTVGRWCGEARLYLQGLETLEDGSVQISYGYSLNGADVSLPGGVPAASFTVRDGQISDYSLCFRRYEQTGQTSLVMRERQAAAALEALEAQGSELILAYSAADGDLVQAGWTAR